MTEQELEALIRLIRSTSSADLLQVIAKAIEQESMSTHADREGYRRVARKHDELAHELWSKAKKLLE